MHIRLMTAVIAIAVSTPVFAGIATEFGTLAYPDGSGGSTEIDFNAGTGNSNTNFVFNNYNIGSSGSESWLTMGLSAQQYYSSSNGPVTNNGVDSFYAYAGADQSGNLPGSGRWGFKWSVTVDGAMPMDGSLYMALRIDGPSGGNWGTTYFPAPIGPNAGTDFAGQDVWSVAYDFMQMSSEETYGAPYAGLWDGMNYNYDEAGVYNFSISVFNDNPMDGGTLIGSTAMNVEVLAVPGVGAFAVFAFAGLVGGRRRR